MLINSVCLLLGMEQMSQPAAQPAAEPKSSKKVILAVAAVAIVGIILVALYLMAGPSSTEPVDTGNQQNEQPVQTSGLIAVCDAAADSLTLTNKLDKALSNQYFNLLDSTGQLIDTNTLGAINLQVGQTQEFPSSYDFQDGQSYTLMGPGLDPADISC